MKNKYILNRRVILSAYDDNWPKWFDEEKKLISSVIGKYDVVIEHIGSTSVNGLSSKPILDIMVGAKDIQTAERCINPLEKIGYEYIPEYEKMFPERRFLHKGENLPNQHVHLHMVAVDSYFWKRHLLFRDYLRNHPKALKEYQELKEKLAVQYKTDVAKYCDAKTEFIENIVKLAEEKKL